MPRWDGTGETITKAKEHEAWMEVRLGGLWKPWEVACISLGPNVLHGHYLFYYYPQETLRGCFLGLEDQKHADKLQTPLHSCLELLTVTLYACRIASRHS